LASNFIGTKKLILLLPTLLMLTLACEAQSDRSARRDSEGDPPPLEIHLQDLGYQELPDYKYPGNGIPRNLSILNDDSKKRITFIDEETLVVYQSHYQTQNPKDAPNGPRSMEAFFVSPLTGKLISRKIWPTIQRRFLNERWDTQARIMAVQGGFLVHAANSLTLYSTNLAPKGKLTLEDGPEFAVTVAPLGRTIHRQRIQVDNQAEGEWFDSNTLVKLRSQHEMAGVTSASDQAVVDRLAHYVQLLRVGEAPRSLYPDEVSHLGLPLFLSESEILSVYMRGFSVLSTTGEKLWGREVLDNKSGLVESHKRSLGGSRFAVSFLGSRRTVFDQVKVPNGGSTIFVYDSAARAQVFHLALGRVTEQVDFDLSPKGDMLAVMLGDTVRVYRIRSL
jgi:hypothetical protein